MTLTLAVYVNALYTCRSEGVYQAELLDALISCVDDNSSFCETKRNVENVFSGSRGFPRPQGSNGKGIIEGNGETTSIVPMIRYMDLDYLANQIHDKVFPLLDSDKASMLFLGLRHIVREDASIFNSNAGKFTDWTGYTPSVFVNLQHIEFSHFLAGLFKFCVLIGRYTSGKNTVKTVRSSDFWNGIEASKSFVIIDNFGTNQSLSDVLSLQGINDYLCAVREEYQDVLTFFDWKRYFRFDELFVCNDIKAFHRRIPGNKAVITNATAPDLMPVGPYIILHGTGGMGKSMMLRHFLFDAIEMIKHRNIVPFFVCLRYYQHKGNKDLVSFILEENVDVWPSLDETVLREILGSGKALILLDGLDEVKSSESEILHSKLQEMIKKYPNNQYIMSSRPFDHNFRSYGQFRTAEICGLREEQISDLLVRVGYMQKNLDRREAFMQVIHERLRTADKSFCENPLLLSIMMLIFSQHRSLPTRRHEFYQQAFSVLFSQHDSSKDGSFIRDLRSKLTESQFQEIFAEFCAKTYFREEYEFTRDQFIAIVSSLKSWQKYKNKTDTDAFLVDACVNLCIMDECGTDYKFIHRTFQEYFCASWLISKTDAQLTKRRNWFDSDRKRTMEDCVFSFLHEMAKIRVEGNLILPVIEECFNPIEGANTYWSYLMNQYPIIPYVIGKPEDITVEPKSSILLYVLETNRIFHRDLVPADIPYEPFFCDTVYFSHAPSMGIPSREEAMERTYLTQGGCQAKVIRRDMFIHTDRLFNGRNIYENLYNFFISKACPLAHEFINLKKYYESLKASLMDDDEDDNTYLASNDGRVIAS